MRTQDFAIGERKLKSSIRMSHLLDTNICSAHFRRPGGLAQCFLQYSGRLFVPTVVLGDLYAGAYHVADPAPLLPKITDLLEDVQVLDFDHACAERFGQVRGCYCIRQVRPAWKAWFGIEPEVTPE
jgi:predicted nucleic acid-binding protein